MIGLLLMLFVISKGRRFDGENTWFYFLWYGLGRAWVEGLRTDSLYLFDWTLMGQPIRVSQALSLVMAAVAAVMLFYHIYVKKCSAEGLLVNQLAKAEKTAEANPESLPESQGEIPDSAGISESPEEPEIEEDLSDGGEN